MSNLLFVKRIFSDKIYWLSVMAAIFLLLCSIVYRDPLTGEKYTFISLFYDETVREVLENGGISMNNILLGYDSGYLWMFCPIIAGIPCVLTKKTERFVLFRTSKNTYFLSKYVSNLLTSGAILLIAYLVYMTLAMILMNENLWTMSLGKKLLSVCCWGVMSAIPSIVLSEFVKNKYLILCIPFVLNYFMDIFLGNIVPYQIWQYISPMTYQSLFLYDQKMIASCSAIMVTMILLCGALKKLIMERRCDCGQ